MASENKRRQTDGSIKICCELEELLEIEDFKATDEQIENVETLLQKLIPLMKDKVQQELQRKKKWLYLFIGIFAGLSVLLTVYEGAREWYRLKEYHASKKVISYEELTLHQLEEYEGYIQQPGISSLDYEEEVEFPMPVTKIIYQDVQDHVLWEK